MVLHDDRKVSKRRTCALLCLLIGSVATRAESQGQSQFGLPAGDQASDSPTFFFDARSTGFSKDGGQQLFDGDVIAIGPQSLVTADKVVIDEKKHYIVAEGHVIVLSNGQYITGEKVELWTDSGDLRIISALLVVNDATESEKIAQEVLGYTSSEVAFEAQRKDRLNEVTNKKNEVRQDARAMTKEGKTVSPDLIRDYARFLEQEDLISRQENPAFAQMSEARRNTLRRRRNFWEQARLSDKVKAPPERAAYFRLSGESLERTNGNDLLARDGVWTPCHCELDEAPAWAFRSSTVAAQPGGYATFSNAILEIKGVPVLYLPWFRIPIKDKRQTGFLPPSFSTDSQSGSVFSQPLFLDLGPDKDMTLKAELFERRGTKIGTEARFLHRRYSGFTLNAEVMRDRLWLTQRANRRELHDLYFDGLNVARQDSSSSGPEALAGFSDGEYARRRAQQRSYWNNNFPECVDADPVKRESCERNLERWLRAPSNASRGMMKWRGQERLTERLSFVSVGEMYSDRRYNSDLYIPESFEAGFETGNGERTLQPVKAQIHYDNREYYLGLGSYFGDNVMTNDRYEGYQLPVVTKARSRLYRIGNSGVPIYASTALDQYRISRVPGMKTDPEATTNFMPSGWWRRWSGSLVAPISSKTAVQVDHFTDFEARHISFDKTKNIASSGSKTYDDRIKDSTIQSLRTGFRFQLPIDGKRPLPGWLGGSETKEDEGVRYIQHVMNWSVTLTGRPTVVRKGPYGEKDNELQGRTPSRIMATDFGETDDNIRDVDAMRPYQLVTFATNHRWKVFSEVWRRLEPDGQPPSKTNAEVSMTWEEKARRELLYSIDHPVKSNDDMFSNDQSKWFISRYQLLDTDYLEPVTFAASISYDYLKEQQRRDPEVGKTRENRPWTDADGTLGVSAFQWNLSDHVIYNTYDKFAKKHQLTLTPPGFLRTNISLGYSLDREAPATSDGSLIINDKREKTATVVTSLTSPIYTTWTWGEQEVPYSDIPSKKYQQKISFVYGSPSQCWGLGFSREKGYDQLEEQATYLLQLSIVFMGQGRDLPNMGNSMERELKKG